jgi:hypothetical protein
MAEEKEGKEEKIRVSTKLYQDEKEYLKMLAERSGRSVSSHIRYLVLLAISDDPD